MVQTKSRDGIADLVKTLDGKGADELVVDVEVVESFLSIVSESKVFWITVRETVKEIELIECCADKRRVGFVGEVEAICRARDEG